jgi:hypothetical protein
MEMFYGGGGRGNPDFRYKVRVKKPFDGMIEWCNDYPVTGTGYFQRYYVDFRDGTNTFSDTHAVFQFELEEAAIMFSLRWS